jgi:lipopolysaccharide/colanic/teichoic acid biosynthesis glycosyltransferase
VLDLAKAFHTIAGERRDVRLLFVGPDEGGLRDTIAAACVPHTNRVHFLDFTDRPQDVMAAADVLCLPSYREGFGSVIIEAAACEVPAVATRIYGIVDAIESGRTGLLHAPGDVPALVEQLRQLIKDANFRRSLGITARSRVESDFRVDRLTAALLSLYSRLLGAPPSVRLKPNTTYATWCPPSGGPNDAAAGWYRRFGKRALDVALTAFALVVLSPWFAVLAILVRATLGPPVLFRQRRPGLHGAPFVLVKFRSMTDRYDEAGRRLPDEERLTRVGRFLRASSLDELPELWNVLVGDMSLVGPRPLLMEYLPRYSARHAARHAVRPGITGLAQVSGRNDLPWEERFELDLRYVERVSLAMDLRILARTVRLVIERRGISQPGHATAQEFSGMESR